VRVLGRRLYFPRVCQSWLVESVDYLGLTPPRVAVLPARVAYLIGADSATGLRRAVQEACTRWGGMSEPIIPVKPGGEVEAWWQQVATAAALDEEVSVDLSPQDAATAGTQKISTIRWHA
jgi:hypothetical protein